MTEQQARGGDGKFILTVEGAQRDAEAARLRSRGLSYRQIAAELGCDTHSAHDAVQRALASIVAEPAAAAQALELDRLDDGLQRLEAAREKILEVLAREHVTVSQGHVVYMDSGEAVPDDDWILKAVDRLIQIEGSRLRNGESRRKLLGLDSPTKMAVSGGITYEVVGVDTEALR